VCLLIHNTRKEGFCDTCTFDVFLEPGVVYLELRDEVLTYAGLEGRGGEEKLFEAVEVLAYVFE